MTTDTTTLTADRLVAELPAMADKIHSTAVEKGWWAKGSARDKGEMLALMVSELSEALEEDREGRPALWFQIGGVRVYPVRDGSGADWTESPHGLNLRGRAATWTGVAAKPEGAAVELADTAIRAMDYLGFFGTRTLGIREHLRQALAVSRADLADRSTSFGARKMVLVGYLVDADRAARTGFALVLHALVGSLVWIEDLGHDPIEVCKLKMAYNDTRAHKHGGKAY